MLAALLSQGHPHPSPTKPASASLLTRKLALSLSKLDCIIVPLPLPPQVAFLWELLSAGYSILISDLDVVWLNGHWPRWMAYGHPLEPPLPEASLIAAADVLVTTDELNAETDISGRRPSSDLNTGVVYFRNGPGAKAVVQAWRRGMLSRKGDKHLDENVNDQSLFNQVREGMFVGGMERGKGGEGGDSGAGQRPHSLADGWPAPSLPSFPSFPSSPSHSTLTPLSSPSKAVRGTELRGSLSSPPRSATPSLRHSSFTPHPPFLPRLTPHPLPPLLLIFPLPIPHR
jgi:hypothetical protein